jgi:hypothetical protein
LDVTSYALGKKYTDERITEQKLKVATVEKELNDFKSTLQQVNINQEAKQSVSGYGIVSLPKNAANGQVSASVGGLTATNLVKNGDFADGTTGWSGIKDNISIVDGVLICSVDLSFTVAQNIYISEGNKFYASLKHKANADTNLAFTFRTDLILRHSILLNQNEPTEIRKSEIFVASHDLNKLIIGRSDVGTSGTHEIDDILVIDLTNTFGAGNEPTKEECDQIFANYFNGTKSTVCSFRIQCKDALGEVKSTAYVTAKDAEGKIALLRSVPSANDEVSVSDGKKTQRVSDEVILKSNDFTILEQISVTYDTLYLNGLGSTFSHLRTIAEDGSAVFMLPDGVVVSRFNSGQPDCWYANTSGQLRLNVEKGKYANLADAQAALAGTTLTYQLAEPVITPVQVSGNIVSHPSGTIIIDHATFSAGVYESIGIRVTEEELPIKSINKITRIDYETGLEYDIDTSKAVISGDKLSFTHSDLTVGDIVFFDYDYNLESTEGETTIEYYDSRYTIKDSVTGKFYKWDVTVADGVPSIALVEV